MFMRPEPPAVYVSQLTALMITEEAPRDHQLTAVTHGLFACLIVWSTEVHSAVLCELTRAFT